MTVYYTTMCIVFEYLIPVSVNCSSFQALFLDLELFFFLKKKLPMVFIYYVVDNASFPLLICLSYKQSSNSIIPITSLQEVAVTI